jgi:S1-C subfamily serine protease
MKKYLFICVLFSTLFSHAQSIKAAAERQKETSHNANLISSEDLRQWRGSGSGFFIDCRGYIATNCHVIEDASDIEVTFLRDGKPQTHKAIVIVKDAYIDLAILKIIDNNFKHFTNIPFNFQTKMSDVGTSVFALGYPMIDIMGYEIKFTDGKINSTTGIQGTPAMYQISVPLQPGNSGGALFDYDGNLIGITTGKLRSDYFENVNYAVKSECLKNLTNNLLISLKLPNDNTIKNKTLTEKIKLLSDYIVLIKIR